MVDHYRDAAREVRGPGGRRPRRRAVPPSNLSLLGLVRHSTQVEHYWLRARLPRPRRPLAVLDAAGPRRRVQRPHLGAARDLGRALPRGARSPARWPARTTSRSLRARPPRWPRRSATSRCTSSTSTPAIGARGPPARGHRRRRRRLRVASGARRRSGRHDGGRRSARHREDHAAGDLPAVAQKSSIPPPGIAGALSSGLSTTTASVVRNSAAIEAAFCSAERVTLAASMTPALMRSSYSPVAAFRPSAAPSGSAPSRRRRRLRGRR